MKVSRYTRTLHFLCSDTEQSHLYINEIEKLLSIPMYRMPLGELMCVNKKQSNRILLVDYKQLPELLEELPNLAVLWKNFELILFNVEKPLPTQEIIRFGHLKGLFYCSDTKPKIAKGITKIIDGESWLPRKITSQLLFYYRNIVNISTCPITVDLTIRELQVIRCLQTGASNTQIAEDLFISEFTVKSHLYQIFRKLAVKNRVQAIAWANQNLIS
ncbi:LuxR C-terminal-related transcriptional regulator [Vibrio pelagius]|uniref:LuxR C-terminal-related transcriptional regulator n=1 Tax=Vibrio pelagius TaxID=28169 RepID=A0ABY5G6E3_VIBPE|nr:LuxR C-terminal-related transcriptional regulator [Vibrio pelagius]UTT85713.1 LuxR C-terminal-related transcriptional regulator [Vibrio pelagius]